jgi:hypothetical protein
MNMTPPLTIDLKTEKRIGELGGNLVPYQIDIESLFQKTHIITPQKRPIQPRNAFQLGFAIVKV